MTTRDLWAPAAFKARVDAVLHEVLSAEADELTAIDPALEPLAEGLLRVARHGKRLRAAFCYWGWRAAGQPDGEALLRAAVSMELVHAAAVVHDDLIDDSPLRHGLPTAHRSFEAGLRDHPHPRAAGRSLALLLGDHLMALAGQLFTECGLPTAYLGRARALWTVLARDLIAGEALEILHTGGTPDTGTSLKVVRYKTAKYTVEQPLLIGALLAGAPEALREGLSDYGIPLGEAFQLRDDLLGLFGDPGRTGKAGLDDIRTRRPTVLLAESLRTADAARGARLRDLLGHADPGETELRDVRALMTDLGAPQRVERMIAGRVERAVRVLDELDLPDHARRALRDLAHSAAVRHH